MLYDDDFVISLPQDPIEAMLKVLDVFFKNMNRLVDVASEDVYEVRDLILALKEARAIKFPDHHTDIATVEGNALLAALSALKKDLSIIVRDEHSEKQKQRFATLLGAAFHYELSNADVTRVQVLVNELRDLIVKNENFEEDHRRRLFSRVEGLQREIHKRLSSLDRFYGFMGDAGILLGKFGTDAKPFVDRIREIVEIVWRSQANAEQLPASARPASLTTEQELHDRSKE